MEWAELIFWAIFIFFMSVVFPIVLVGCILCVAIRRQHQIRPVPSTPYIIDQTARQTEPPYPGILVSSYPNNSIQRNSMNDNSVNLQIRDVPPPYSTVPGSQFPVLQPQLPYPEQNVAHFPVPSSGRRVRFNIEKPPIFDDGNYNHFL
ncbi:hypothetical protein ACKWTF_011039 [Chironomus riparius]